MFAAIIALMLVQTGPISTLQDARVQIEKEPVQPAQQGLDQSLNSANIPVLRELARQHAAAKRFSQAIAAYERILVLDRRDADAWSHLAELHSWSGNQDKAIVAYQDGLAILPGNRALKNGLGQVLRWTRRYDEAEALYREVLTSAPDDRDALRGLADVCARTGNFKEARTLIDRAIRLRPRDAELYKVQGNIFAWQKEYAKAVASLEKAVDLSPSYTNAYVALGDVYLWTKSYEKAGDVYKRALALEPDNIEVLLMLARVYERTENRALALRTVRHALDINPMDSRANELLRELEGSSSLSAVEAAGHMAEYLTFAIVFFLVYLNFRRSKRLLRRRHRFYHLFTHYVLPGVASLAFLIYLFESHVIRSVQIDPEVFHSIGESVIVVVLGMSFLSFLSADRRPASASSTVILAIGAHPDDVELGCGGYLLKAKDSGARIYALTASKGERGTNGGNDRRAEQLKAAAFLDLDGIWNLGLPDTKVREHLREVVEAIEEKVRETGATVILTHSPYDVHSDHQAVFDATKEAARNASAVLCYEDVGTAKEFVPNYFVDITDYLEDKIRLVMFHRTQRDKMYMDPDTIRGRAAHRGLQSNTPFAEAYRIHRMVR